MLASRPSVAPSEPAPVLQRILAQDPDLPALISDELAVPYRALGARAARVGHALRHGGVGAGDRVVVALPRSIDLVVAVLGVWMSGATMFLLDPLQPEARRRSLVARLRPSRVLSSGEARARFPELDGFLDLDTLPWVDHCDPPEPSGADGVAALMTTSGTTGRPKLIQTTHIGLSLYERSLQAHLQLGPGDRYLFRCNSSFDVIYQEIIVPLCSGATMVLAPQGEEADVPKLVDRIRRFEVTVVEFVPSLLRRVLDDVRRTGPLPTVRHLVSGGAALVPSLATALCEAGLPRVWNLYGPAEASIGVTFGQFDGQVHGSRVPVGRALDGVELSIRRADLSRVGPGEAGELCIAGRFLSPGYLDDPAATARAFVRAPEDGQRIYRTGDQASWLPGGQVLLGGRLDDQVKVRGVRIEPDEVTHALLAQPGVLEAFVGLEAGADGDKRLVAWVAGTAEPAALRRQLAETLPAAFVPQVRRVPRLPRLPSGKVDRHALRADPEPAASAPAPGRALTVQQVYEAARLGDLVAVLEGAPPASPRLRADAGPTPAQRRLLAIDAVVDHAQMVVSACLEVSGPVDLEGLRRAVALVSALYPSLGRGFGDGPAHPPALRWERTPDDAARLVRARTVAAEGFDPQAGPVARVVWLDGLLVFAAHHAVLDDIGLRAWIGQVLAAADAPVLRFAGAFHPPRPVTDPEGLARHWRTHLAGAPALLDLPADRAAPAGRSPAATMVRRTLDAELSGALQDRARALRVTPFALVVAATAWLVRRAVGTREVVLGTMVDHRGAAADTVGMAVDALPLRLALPDGTRGDQLVQAAMREIVHAVDHKALPFDALVQALGHPRSAAFEPVFQVFVQQRRQDGLRLGGQPVRPLPAERWSRTADLSVDLEVEGAALTLQLLFAVDRFDPATTEAYTAALLDLLAQLVAADARPLDDIAPAAPVARQAWRHLAGLPHAGRAWFPLSPWQRYLWLDEQQRSDDRYCTATALELPAGLDPDAAAEAVEQVMATAGAHRVAWRSPGLQAFDRDRGAVARIAVDTLATSDDRMAAVAAWHAAACDAPERRDAPEVALFTAPDGIALGARAHHLAIDGWGGLVLARRLVAALSGEGAVPADDLQGALQADLVAEAAAARADDLGWWRGRCAGDWGPALVESLGSPGGEPGHGLVRQPVDPGVFAALQRLAFRQRATPTELWLGLVVAWLGRVTGRTRLCVGVPATNRTAETRGLVAQRVTQVPLVVDLQGELEAQVGEVVSEARRTLAHATLPVDWLVADAGLDPAQLDVMVNLLLQARPLALDGQPLELRWVAAPSNALAITVLWNGRGSAPVLELRFDTARLRAADVQALGAGLLGFLDGVAATALQAPQPNAAERALVARLAARQVRFVVAATFTPDPLVPEVARWAQQVGWHATVESAGYQPLPSTLLDPGSPVHTTADAVALVFVRVADARRDDPDADVAAWVDEQAAAVRAAAARVPTLLVVLAPSPGVWDAAEQRLVAGLDGIPVVTPRGASDVHDPRGDALAHLPYTPAGVAQLARAAVRRAHLARRPPFKVIAVDCDHTLWSGVAAEDGVQGVVLDPTNLALQAALVRASEAGVVIALVSRNLEADVWAVFDGRDDMVLKREHITLARVNWEAKSDNLLDIAATLSLGLDSIVFLDDNPVELAEVGARLPAVTAIPFQHGAGPAWVGQLWPLDTGVATEADRRRQQSYRDAGRRRQARSEAPDFAAFLAGLQLQIEVAPIDARTARRAAQLTQRTNQFNLDPSPLRLPELSALLAEPAVEARLLTVSDRFGAYGQVGMFLGAVEGDRFAVRTLLMSCRVLGRGVEHALARALAAVAAERGCVEVVLPCRATPRNLPVRRFLAQLPAVDDAVPAQAGETGRLHVRVADLQDHRLDPRRSEADYDRPATVAATPDPGRFPLPTGAEWAALAGAALLPASGGRSAGATRAPGTDTERAVAEVFAAVLGRGSVGVDDDFFVLGGSSLAAVDAVRRLDAALGIEVPLPLIFEDARVGALAAAIDVFRAGGGLALPPEVAFDRVLADAVQPPPGTPLAGLAGATVLLTGATGFLGAWLVQELLDHGVARVVALVRPGDVGAEARLRTALADAGVAADDRVEAWAGDLAAPALGLTSAQQAELAGAVDVILHCGSRVDLMAPYSDLRHANVRSLHALLELASRGRPKSVHLVSTLALFGEPAVDRAPASEDTVLAAPEFDRSGYGVSKWTAEQVLDEAARRGFETTVHRPSVIVGVGSTGRFADRGLGSAVVQLVMELRAVPVAEQDQIWVVPVDRAARQIVGLIDDPARPGRVFHITDWPALTAPRLGALVGEVAGACAVVDGPQWLDRVRAHLSADPDHPAWALMPVLESMFTAAPAPHPAPPLLQRPLHHPPTPHDHRDLVPTLRWVQTHRGPA